MKSSSVFCVVLVLFLSRAAFSNPVAGGEPQKVRDRFFADGIGVKVESWIEDLEIPWSLVFLGDGRALVSERPGRIRLIRN